MVIVPSTKTKTVHLVHGEHNEILKHRNLMVRVVLADTHTLATVTETENCVGVSEELGRLKANRDCRRGLFCLQRSHKWVSLGYLHPPWKPGMLTF